MEDFNSNAPWKGLAFLLAYWNEFTRGNRCISTDNAYIGKRLDIRYTDFFSREIYRDIYTFASCDAIYLQRSDTRLSYGRLEGYLETAPQEFSEEVTSYQVLLHKEWLLSLSPYSVGRLSNQDLELLLKLRQERS